VAAVHRERVLEHVQAILGGVVTGVNHPPGINFVFVISAILNIFLGKKIDDLLGKIYSSL
jgi:hypothetical protein